MKNIDGQQKLILKIALSLVLISFIILIFYKDNFIKKSQFVPPLVEQSAISGKPLNIPKEYMYKEVKVNDHYIVYLCAVPLLNNKRLTIYFTSFEDNEGLIKIKILDKDDNLIGESGLISPNSYIKDILLNKDLQDKEKITIKVMHYEKETYYSLGTIKLDLLVRKNID